MVIGEPEISRTAETLLSHQRVSGFIVQFNTLHSQQLGVCVSMWGVIMHI